MNLKGLRIAAAVVLLAGMLLPRRADAQLSDGLQIYFTPNSSRAIAVVLSTSGVYTSTFSYNFATILVASAAVSNVPLVVTNIGNMATTLAVQVSSTATDLGLSPSNQPLNQFWTVSSSTVPGQDTFVLFAAFQSTQPANGSIAIPSDLVGVNPVLASSGTAGMYQGSNQNGVLVPAVPGTNTVDLWFDLYVPQRSSNLFAKVFNVTVTGN